MSKMRVLIVDDHGIVRAGIRSLLEGQEDIEVVGEASNGDEAIAKARELKPDLILMDIAMPGMNGIEATRQIKQELQDTSILVLSMHDDEEFFFPVLRAGASGYALKEAEPQELLYAIRTVHQGHIFLAPAVATTLLEGYVSAGPEQSEESYGSLTRREKEVLRLAAGGKTNREMAESLFLSSRTVEKYRQAVMHKLGLSKREELTKYAIRRGLIDSD